MVGLLVTLLVIWVILAVLGFAVHALLWLAYVGIILFIVTVVFGALMRFIRGRA